MTQIHVVFWNSVIRQENPSKRVLISTQEFELAEAYLRFDIWL